MSYYGGAEPLEMEAFWDRSHKITGKTEDSEGCNRKVGLVPILAGNSIHWRPVDRNVSRSRTIFRMAVVGLVCSGLIITVKLGSHTWPKGQLVVF